MEVTVVRGGGGEAGQLQGIHHQREDVLLEGGGR